jgi:membrane protein
MLIGMRARAEPVIAVGVRAVRKFLHIEGTVQATVIAAQAFTSLIPFLVVCAAFGPGNGDLGDRIVDQLNLEGASARSVDALFNSAGETQSTVTWIGIIILVLSGLSFTRAVQRTYARAYAVELKPAVAAARGLWWLAFFALWLLTAVSLRNTITDETGPAVGVVLASATGFAFWLITPLLLLGSLEWRRIVPGAVATGISVGLLGVVSQIWIPLLVKWSAEKYGLIGIAFSLQTWLLVYSFIVVAAAAFGAALSEQDAAEA